MKVWPHAFAAELSAALAPRVALERVASDLAAATDVAGGVPNRRGLAHLTPSERPSKKRGEVGRVRSRFWKSSCAREAVVGIGAETAAEALKYSACSACSACRASLDSQIPTFLLHHHDNFYQHGIINRTATASIYAYSTSH